MILSGARQANHHHVKPAGDSAGQPINRVLERYRHANLRLRDRPDVGVQLVNNLMTDAITTQRWYGSGHGPLGPTWAWASEIGRATLTVIAEEFPPPDEPIRLSRLVDVFETSMLKRIAHGRPFGVADVNFSAYPASIVQPSGRAPSRHSRIGRGPPGGPGGSALAVPALARSQGAGRRDSRVRSWRRRRPVTNTSGLIRPMRAPMPQIAEPAPSHSDAKPSRW